MRCVSYASLLEDGDRVEVPVDHVLWDLDRACCVQKLADALHLLQLLLEGRTIAIQATRSVPLFG